MSCQLGRVVLCGTPSTSVGNGGWPVSDSTLGHGGQAKIEMGSFVLSVELQRRVKPGLVTPRLPATRPCSSVTRSSFAQVNVTSTLDDPSAGHRKAERDVNRTAQSCCRTAGERLGVRQLERKRALVVTLSTGPHSLIRVTGATAVSAAPRPDCLGILSGPCRAATQS